MNPRPASDSTHSPWPRWWRFVVVAIGTLILCSCRAGHPVAGPYGHGPAPSPALPQQAYTGDAAAYLAEADCPGDDAAIPLPSAHVAPWTPPGARAQPWPPDEYLFDGGDQAPATRIAADWEVHGLNAEDTVGHFDTLDGRTVVVPSNRVSIYSPRFGAVRQVVSLRENEQWDPWVGIHQPLQPAGHADVQIAASSKQQYQPEGHVGRSLASIYQTKQGDGAVSNAYRLESTRRRILPGEAPAVLGQNTLEAAETAWLADGVEAALAWSRPEGLQIILDRTRATVETSDQKVETIFTVKEPEARPRLRVIKTASTPYAAPGETVDFTIRFDNVGNQPIGNVTILDNLTTRLEYVPDSAQCTVAADFFTEPNQAESLVLRWEVTEPLEPGQGGVVQFQCRVR